MKYLETLYYFVVLIALVSVGYICGYEAGHGVAIKAKADACVKTFTSPIKGVTHG